MTDASTMDEFDEIADKLDSFESEIFALTEDEFREWVTPRLEEYLLNFGATLMGRPFDVIDPESRAEAVEFYSNLFARVAFDPANLKRIR